jgi:outer membrane protein OmpA-like peptidoglycan-associated protein
MARPWPTVGTVASLVTLVHFGPAALAAEPGLALASQATWGSGAPTEFQSLVGDRVFFSEGSAELGTRARKTLAAQAAWLASRPTVRVTIEGHADDPGGLDHQLSEHRAQAVRQRLIEAGIAPERIRIVAYGRRQLIAACEDPLCPPQNRRAVTVVGWPTAATDPRGAGSSERGGVGRPSPRRLY